MISSNRKYAWIALLPTEVLTAISSTGVVPYDIALKHGILNLPKEAIARVIGTATYYLNQRTKPPLWISPAQNRAKLLNNTKFALVGMKGLASNTGKRLMHTADTDLTRTEVYELQMQISWLGSEIDIALAILSKLSASKILPPVKKPKKGFQSEPV